MKVLNMPNAGNQGIIVTGGEFNSRNTTVGQNAKTETTHYHSGPHDGSSLLDLQRELDNLLQLVRSESARLPAKAVTDVEIVANEAKSAEPNKVQITSMLDSVAKLVTSFGSLSGSIIAVRELATAVLK